MKAHQFQKKMYNFELHGRGLACIYAALLAACYLIIQLQFSPHLPIVMDEFQGASTVYRSVHEVPYRDYEPYKPVLGYWVQAAMGGKYETAAQYVQDIKVGIYFVNALAIALLALIMLRMPQIGSGWAVFYSAAILCLVSTFVERSGALRVDMLTIWFGLFASLEFLRERFFTAGLLIGLGFLVSQKIYFFAVAWFVSLSLHWVLYDRSLDLLKKGVLSLVACLSVVAAYILLFSSVSSLSVVIDSLFIANQKIAFGNLYEGLGKFWVQSIERNFLFFVLVATAFLGLLIDFKNVSKVHRKILFFGVVFSALCLNHVQPWPYFIPFLLVVSLLVVPAWLSSNERKGPYLYVFLAITLVFQAGVLVDRYLILQNFNNSYQYDQLELMEASLEEGDYYLAGVNMLPRAKHIENLLWLDQVRLRQIRDDESFDVVSLLNERSPKFILRNYRLYGLPGDISGWLDANYESVCGNLLQKKVSITAAGEKILEDIAIEERNCSKTPFFNKVYSY